VVRGEFVGEAFDLGERLGWLAGWCSEQLGADTGCRKRLLQRGRVERGDGLVGDDGGAAAGDEVGDETAGVRQEARANDDVVAFERQDDADGDRAIGGLLANRFCSAASN